MGSHIVPAGWHNWKDPANETTARYGEYGSTGPGAKQASRVGWAKNPSAAEVAELLDLGKVFSHSSSWTPADQQH